MKILALVGSPRKNGNGAAIARELGAAAEKNGHSFSMVYLYDRSINPCIACDACTQRKVEICVHHDDFQNIARDIIKADCLVFVTPIYMGHVSGTFKNMMDRWYTFAEEHFSIRHVEGKKFVTITTSGGPVQSFAAVSEYLKHWFGEFFKMYHVGSIIAGDLSDPGDAEDSDIWMGAARELGSRL